MAPGVIRQLFDSFIEKASTSSNHLLCALIGFVTLWIILTIYDVLHTPTARYPDSIPRVGHTGVFSTILNFKGYFTKYTIWMQEGYDKYNRLDLPFVIPGPLDRPANIMLPASWTSWYLSQPDSLLSIQEAHKIALYSELNFLDPHVTRDAFHSRVIHKYLQRNIVTLIPYIHTLVIAMGPKILDEKLNKEAQREASRNGQPSIKNLGKWPIFYKINLWDTMLKFVLTITNYLILGLELDPTHPVCKSFATVAHLVILNTFIFSSFPKICHSILGPLLTLPIRWHYRKIYNILLPHIEHRLSILREKLVDPTLSTWKEPEDYLTWHIRLAIAENNKRELSPTMIVKRLLAIEFAALHTTTLTAHSFFLDILSSPKSESWLEELRCEMKDALRTSFPGGDPFWNDEMKAETESDHQPIWTKESLAKLVKLDSALRESQRLRNIAPFMVERVVMDPKGIVAPDGTRLPQGALLALNMQGNHHDPDIYENPNEYDPWRFSRELSESDGAVKRARFRMTTTSERQLGFGHGRHSCPGRFFVSKELKIIAAYMLLHLNFSPKMKRYEHKFVGQTIMPAIDANLECNRMQFPLQHHTQHHPLVVP